MQNFFFANRIFFYVIGIIAFFVLAYSFFINAPADFPIGTVTKIKQGMSLRNVSRQLKNEHLIRSRLAFEAFIIILGREKNVIYSDYYFENKLPVYEIARRISKGEHHMAPIVVTIPEGFKVNDIANAFRFKLVNFNEDKFLLEAKNKEGYLFPDTYFFFTTDAEQEVIKSMSENFEKKISSLRPSIISSGKKEKDIIIMASLVEGEAQGDADREFISGILWKRLSLGMPLQVDIAPETYKTKDLPKSPIGNPGLEAIRAALYPQKSAYLYYLHDKEGNIHYAKNFSEHKINKLKYLTR